MASRKFWISLLLISIFISHVQTSVPDTLLVPVGSEIKANCACGRINDLEAAKLGIFPWLIRLISKNDVTSEPLCWGSLINDRYVLSAAHCTSKYSPVEVEIHLGQFLAQQNPIREVSSIKNHPGYTIGNHTYDNDISLIKLRHPIDLNSREIVPVCLPPLAPKDFETNETKYNFTIRSQECGFIQQSENNTMTMSEFKGFEIVDRKMSPLFEKVNLKLLRNTTCSKLYPSRIKAQVLCADVIGNHGPHKSKRDDDKCHGDSGSSLLYLRRMKSNCDPDFNNNESSKDDMKVRFLQLGLVSAQPQINCTSKSHRPVMVFTRISRYISWIRDNTADGTFCINSPN